jgi:tetratricopeptide (TPR) repeat protein
MDAERRLPGADPGRRHRMTLALATARQRVGDMHGMTQALHEAMAAARAREDAVALAEAATTFRSSGVWYWREMGTEDAATLSALHESLRRVDDARLRARLWASLGQEQYGLFRAREADESTARGLELARLSGDPETLHVCLAARCLVLWAPGAAAAHEAAAREMVALDLTPEDAISARFHLAVALHHQMRMREADEVMAQAAERATELRHTNCDVPLAWWRWMRALENGAPDAHVRAEEALSLHRRTTMMSLDEGAGLVALEELADGAEVPADLLALGKGHPHYAVRVAVAHAVLRAGHVQDAVEVAGALPTSEEHDYASLWASCRHVDVLVAAGAQDDLMELVRRLTPHAAESATFGSVLSDGSAALYLGTALAALGRTGEAEAALTEALLQNGRAGLLRWEQEARRRLATLRRDEAASPSAER